MVPCPARATARYPAADQDPFFRQHGCLGSAAWSGRFYVADRRRHLRRQPQHDGFPSRSHCRGVRPCHRRGWSRPDPAGCRHRHPFGAILQSDRVARDSCPAAHLRRLDGHGRKTGRPQHRSDRYEFFLGHESGHPAGSPAAVCGDACQRAAIHPHPDRRRDRDRAVVEPEAVADPGADLLSEFSPSSSPPF